MLVNETIIESKNEINWLKFCKCKYCGGKDWKNQKFVYVRRMVDLISSSVDSLWRIDHEIYLHPLSRDYNTYVETSFCFSTLSFFFFAHRLWTYTTLSTNVIFEFFNDSISAHITGIAHILSMWRYENGKLRQFRLPCFIYLVSNALGTPHTVQLTLLTFVDFFYFVNIYTWNWKRFVWHKNWPQFREKKGQAIANLPQDHVFWNLRYDMHYMMHSCQSLLTLIA